MNQPTITSHETLVAAITDARKSNNDKLAIHLYLIHGGTYNLNFHQLTLIDPLRHSERLARLELARVPYDPDNPEVRLKNLRRKTDQPSIRTKTSRLFS